MKVNTIKDLFFSWHNEEDIRVSPLEGAGSARNYYRVSSQKYNAIGVVGNDLEENKAFIAFSKHLKKQGLPVPEIYAYALDFSCYLIEDFGDDHLFDCLIKREKATPDPLLFGYLKKALQDLSDFQILGYQGFDFSKAYPIDEFNDQLMRWDLNYFKYSFLKPSGTGFHEQKLENDFSTLRQCIAVINTNFFMYRDFQSRNIMIQDGELRYIDYQGAMQGPRAYDVVSLLFQARTALPAKTREELLDYYISINRESLGEPEEQFRLGYYRIALLRTLQVLGAYGFRGLVEHKLHFVRSIPFAMDNLRFLLTQKSLFETLPELKRICEEISSSPQYFHRANSSQLTIHLSSFSYKKGYPADKGQNGGGFAFDCRALPNPGRLQEYKHLTGMDEPVIQYLQQYKEVDEYLQHAVAMVSKAVENYLERGFTDLSVAFGCTGGQHRSVYCAEKMNEALKKYPVKVNLFHREQS